MKKLYILLIISFPFLFSCSTIERPEGQTEAEILFKEAEQLVKEERFLMAMENLNIIRTKHPYSYYAAHAELLQADVAFLEENYIEAASAYLLFKDFHPKHQKMDYVIWKIAESFFKQVPNSYDRDLEACGDAVNYYKELLEKFPSSHYSKSAKKNIAQCGKMIIEKEKYIADFYFKTERYDSAMYRYGTILEHFSERWIRDHSILRLLNSAYFSKEKEKCLSAYKKFVTELSEKDARKASQLEKKCLSLQVKDN